MEKVIKKKLLELSELRVKDQILHKMIDELKEEIIKLKIENYNLCEDKFKAEAGEELYKTELTKYKNFIEKLEQLAACPSVCENSLEINCENCAGYNIKSIRDSIKELEEELWF